MGEVVPNAMRKTKNSGTLCLGQNSGIVLQKEGRRTNAAWHLLVRQRARANVWPRASVASGVGRVLGCQGSYLYVDGVIIFPKPKSFYLYWFFNGLLLVIQVLHLFLR